MTAPSTLTLTPELTEDLRAFHDAQDFLDAIETTLGIEDEVSEMLAAQQERLQELGGDLLDLMDHLTGRPGGGPDA